MLGIIYVLIIFNLETERTRDKATLIAINQIASTIMIGEDIVLLIHLDTLIRNQEITIMRRAMNMTTIEEDLHLTH